MLVEKKSLRRFLFIYIISTFFLLSVGGYYYYKVSYQSILNQKQIEIKKEIENFIQLNRTKKILKENATPIYLDFPIAIYKNKIFLKGNFNFNDIDFSKEHYVKDNKLYYIHTEHKPWGNVYLVTYKDINRCKQKLINNIVVFFIFSSIFIVIIAYILGKIFIKPLKDTIISLENFITDATHEINTPISNILMNLELLKELHPELSKTDELDKISSSSFRISKIFKDLSFISFNHSTKKEYIQLNADEILKQRLDFFKTMIKNKNLNLKLDIKPLKVKMDKEDLIRLFDNLLSNAIKYSKPNKTIHVKLNNYFEVTNEGDIKNIKNITKKFVRENKNEGGFGIGLYIVKKIAENYNFEFSIYSNDGKVISKLTLS